MLAVIDLAAVGGFENLQPYVQASAELQWSDINSWTREVGSVYEGKIIGLPFYYNLPYLYYRCAALWLARMLVCMAMPCSASDESCDSG